MEKNNGGQKLKLLVTGGGGFIGSALLVSLSHANEILCLDHGRKYPQLQTRMQDNVRLVKGDITNIDLIDELMQDVDVVVHLAGGGGNTACTRNPANAVMTYIYGTHLLLQKAKEYNVKRFIFASTQSVYSTFKKREKPLREDLELVPDDLYGALKAAAEYEIRDSMVDYVILRFANVYGYGSGLFGAAELGGAIGNFIKAAYEGSDITIFGTGEQKIDYVHISDVCRGIEMVLENTSINNEIFNIGSGHLHSIEEIAKIVAGVGEEMYKRNVNIKKVAAPQGKIWPDRLMPIEKLKQQLNWCPSISLKKGISEMIEKYEGGMD